MFWSGIARYMESFVKDCAICIRHWEQANKIEPLIPHHRGDHPTEWDPWMKIGIDIYDLDQIHLLVITGYYINLTMVERIKMLET